jgi:hypothetical protein
MRHGSKAVGLGEQGGRFEKAGDERKGESGNTSDLIVSRENGVLHTPVDVRWVDVNRSKDYEGGVERVVFSTEIYPDSPAYAGGSVDRDAMQGLNLNLVVEYDHRKGAFIVNKEGLDSPDPIELIIKNANQRPLSIPYLLNSQGEDGLKSLLAMTRINQGTIARSGRSTGAEVVHTLCRSFLATVLYEMGDEIEVFRESGDSSLIKVKDLTDALALGLGDVNVIDHVEYE